MALLIFFVVILTVALASAKPAVKHYASKYDHIDVETILNNPRMVKYYSACLLSQGPCPPEGVEFKRILPEALHTNCHRCTEKQATVTLRAIKRLKKEYPKIWSQLSQMWDPDDVYVRKFESTFGNRNKIPSVVVNNGWDLGSSTTSNADEPRPDTTTHQIITSPNIMSFTTSKTSSTPITTSSTANPSTKTSTTTVGTTTKPPSRPAPIPGLLPINTFFTNPPIPIRPIVNLNLGANIGATVKAIKQVEKAVADAAVQKIILFKSMLLMPWWTTKRRKRFLN